jgi:hypothetical protein
MVIDCNVAAVTVSATTFEVIPACPAVTLLEPTPVPVARPLLPMVAAAVFEEVQVTEFVRLCVLPSVKVPVAVNWSVRPFATELVAALMVIDCSVAAVTVRARLLDVIPLCDALTLLEPIPVPVARPLELMVAVAVFEEVHVAELVRFWVLPSVKVPVAVN